MLGGPALQGAGQDWASGEGQGLAGGRLCFLRYQREPGEGLGPSGGQEWVGVSLPCPWSILAKCPPPGAPRAQRPESQTLLEGPAVWCRGQEEVVVISYLL